MEKFIKGYKDVMTYIGILGLIGFIVSVMIQVIARTFLPTAPNWTEEAARYLFHLHGSFRRKCRRYHRRVRRRGDAR